MRSARRGTPLALVIEQSADLCGTALIQISGGGVVVVSLTPNASRCRHGIALGLLLPALLWSCGQGVLEVSPLGPNSEGIPPGGDSSAGENPETSESTNESGEPTPVCGDGVSEGDEICDSETRDCATLEVRFVEGIAACNASCTDFDLSACVEEPPTVEEVIDEISEDRLKEFVYYLASDELAGRKPGTDGDDKAQAYIEEQFKLAGLLPGNGTSYRQPFNAGGTQTANVIGYLPGTAESSTRDEVIVVGGHFDHLGGSGQSIYNGADDNASGTATVMELAHAAGKLKGELKRTVVFMAFGAEEMGLIGSEYYCETEPIFPIDDTVLMLNFDMVGRRSGRASSEQPEAARRGGTDSASFQDVGVETEDWFTGLHDDYHRTSDTADKLNYAGMEKIATEGLDILWNASQRSRSARSVGPHAYEQGGAFLDHGVAPFRQ